MKYQVDHMPTPEEIANGNSRQTIAVPLPNGSGYRNGISINLSTFVNSVNRKNSGLFTYNISSRFYSLNSDGEEIVSDTARNNSAVWLKVADICDYLDSITPEVCDLLRIRFQRQEDERKEFKRLDAIERENDDVFGTKEANRIVREMHKKAKDKSYGYSSGTYIFVPSGLDRDPVELKCGGIYTGSNVYFYKGSYSTRIRRDVAVDIIANSSKAKTMFARLAN